MSFETLFDGAVLASRYLFLAALYYVCIAYPVIWIRRRRRAARVPGYLPKDPNTKPRRPRSIA